MKPITYKPVPTEIQLLSFQEFRKTAAQSADLTTDLKVILVLSYFLTFSNEGSEHNLLTLFRFVGLDFGDKTDQSGIYNILSFYAGADIFRIIDNDLGIKEIVDDVDSETFQAGKEADVTEVKDQIKKLRQRFFTEIARGWI